MPGKGTNQTQQDTELNAKLDALARALGHALPAKTFENVSIAESLGIGKARITDMRHGRIPFRPHHMAALVAHYRLEGTLDPVAFNQPVEQFEKLLRDLRIGIHGGGKGRNARQALFDLSDPAQVTGGRCSIEIDLLKHSRRAGGLGVPAEDRAGPAQLREGDRVRLRVEYPGSGYLVVLDEQLGTEMTCLMPSMFAPLAMVRGSSLRLPTPDTDPLTASFHVARPEGLHRLFAVWTKEPPTTNWINGPPEDLVPPIVDDDALTTFVDGIRAQVKKTPGKVAVAIADYRVI